MGKEIRQTTRGLIGGNLAEIGCLISVGEAHTVATGAGCTLSKLNPVGYL